MSGIDLADLFQKAVVQTTGFTLKQLLSVDQTTGFQVFVYGKVAFGLSIAT